MALYRFLFAPVVLVVAALAGAGGRDAHPAAPPRAPQVRAVPANAAPAPRPLAPRPVRDTGHRAVAARTR